MLKSRMLGNPLVRFWEGQGGNLAEVPCLLDVEPGNGSLVVWVGSPPGKVLVRPPETEARSEGRLRGEAIEAESGS